MAVSTIDRTSTSNATGRRLVPVLALTALISTILLITMGSIVRVTGYGLGCPDWPLCYGQVIPPTVLGAWVEFSHRLLGGLAGIQIVLLGLFAWRDYRDRPWVFWPAIAAVGLLIVQVSLGGLHVIFEIPPVTGWIHTGVAMLVAGLTAVWVAILTPITRRLGQRTAATFAGTHLPLWTAIAATATFILLLTGSLVTRSGASLVCPSFPFCGLAVIPDNLWSMVIIQMVHRVAAFLVAISICLVLYFLWRASRQDRGLKRIGWILAGLLVLQILLGMGNVLLTLPMWTRVMHLGTGATIWVAMVILSVVVIRGDNQRIESSLV